MAKKEKETVKVSEYLSASYILDKPKKVISIGPAADIVLNGGIPDGTICILESSPKIGKTTLALKIGANAQKQHGKKVVYCSIENRLSEKNLRGVDGLDLSEDMFKLIASTEGNILSTEANLERAEKALNDFPGCVLIFDSFSALSSAAEKTKGYGEGYGGIDSRKLEGEFMRKISPIVLVNGSILIGIAHIAPRIGGIGSSTKISQATLYQHDIRLSMKKVYPQGDWTSGDKLIGQKINIECLTSALGAPGGSWVGWLKYGRGFLDSAELAQLSIDLALVEKKGAGWFSIGEEFADKVQGMDALCELIESRQDIREYLSNSVKHMLEK